MIRGVSITGENKSAINLQGLRPGEENLARNISIPSTISFLSQTRHPTKDEPQGEMEAILIEARRNNRQGLRSRGDR
jgi:hypothetical protein